MQKNTGVIPSKEFLAARRILVVGDVMLDRYWFGAVDRISPEAPVPVVRVSHEEHRLGGAANVALNVKTLGARATLLSMVGQDDAAVRLRDLLQAQGVEALLSENAQLQTIVKLRVIGRSQQLLRVDFEAGPTVEALSSLLENYERVLMDHDVVLFSDYGKGGLAHIDRMIELARQAGKDVLIDPKGSDYSRYAGATMITPNRSEMAEVIGAWQSEQALEAGVQALREKLGLQAILLTRSEEGMSLFDATGATHEPAQTREVYDVTGAGDTVIATVAVMLACGVPPREAMVWANRAGGIVVGKFGTAHVSYEELFA